MIEIFVVLGLVILGYLIVSCSREERKWLKETVSLTRDVFEAYCVVQFGRIEDLTKLAAESKDVSIKWHEALIDKEAIEYKLIEKHTKELAENKSGLNMVIKKLEAKNKILLKRVSELMEEQETTVVAVSSPEPTPISLELGKKGYVEVPVLRKNNIDDRFSGISADYSEKS